MSTETYEKPMNAIINLTKKGKPVPLKIDKVEIYMNEDEGNIYHAKFSYGGYSVDTLYKTRLDLVDILNSINKIKNSNIYLIVGKGNTVMTGFFPIDLYIIDDNPVLIISPLESMQMKDFLENPNRYVFNLVNISSKDDRLETRIFNNYMKKDDIIALVDDTINKKDNNHKLIGKINEQYLGIVSDIVKDVIEKHKNKNLYYESRNKLVNEVLNELYNYKIGELREYITEYYKFAKDKFKLEPYILILEKVDKEEESNKLYLERIPIAIVGEGDTINKKLYEVYNLFLF
ncbi:hypothetical protein YN1_7830 [Nanoarchaeota archaeon]